MKTTLINTWKEWGVICFTPMVAIDFEDKSFRIAWIIFQCELSKKQNKMITEKVTIEEVVNNNAYCPISIDVFPNLMGINLVSVDSVEYTKQEDGQLVSMTVNFIPSND